MQIGPYILIEELAQGGMAQVWLARRVWPDGKRRSCVIKLPRRNAVVDEGILRQFVEEGRLAILLIHNNIVTVFDVGVHEGLPYLVMDYVSGKDLARLLRATARTGSPWEVEDAVHVVREVGHGLLYAHELELNGVPQRVIHRDVSSKNVLVDGSGGVRLTDFGVATSLATETSKVHAKGTLAYMAPEHYLGQVCQGSDVFGLGAILWELLAGRPFRGELEGSALIAAVVSGKVDPVGCELAPAVQRVLDGMLHPDARQRLTLREVLQALEPFPNRRLSIQTMVEIFFGREAKRTGHTASHFAASKELTETLAVAKAAGISVEELEARRPASKPVPPDFVPRPIEDTAPMATAAVATALGDDADADDPPPLATMRLAPSVGRSSKRAGGAEEATPTALVAPPGTERMPVPEHRPPWPSPEPGSTPTTVRTPVGVADTQPSGSAPLTASPAPRRARRRWLSFAVVATVLGLGFGSAAWLVVSGARQRNAVAEGEPVANVGRASRMESVPAPRSVAVAAPSASAVPARAPAAERPRDDSAPEAPVSVPEQDQPAAVTPESLPDAPPDAPPPLAKPKPAPPKAAPLKPKVEVVLRRGLMVSFAEIRIGSGKPQLVPAKGALTLQVTAGTRTLRYRTAPEGDWSSLPYLFSVDMKYAGHIEHNGLRLTAAPNGGR